MNEAEARPVPAGLPPEEVVPASRLLVTLAFGGAFAGLLVATVYEKTLPSIQRYADSRIAGAVNDVLGSPARLETLYLVGDALSRTAPAGVELRDVTKAYVGYDAQGNRLGVAVEAAEPGFADDVRLLVGFDPVTHALTGYAVLSQKETPGLGDKIEKDLSFVARFKGKVTPVKGTKATTADASTVQTITGATISSRAVIQIINNAVALWQPRLMAFDKEATQ